MARNNPETVEWSLAPLYKEIEALIADSMAMLPLLSLALLVMLVTVVACRLITTWSERFFRSRFESALLSRLAARVVSVPLLVLGCYLVFRILGLSQLAATVVGGTGLIGIILGIAFRNITENSLASVLISLQRPFRIGDLVKILDYTGFIQSVTSRGTVLMTLEGNHVQIPNSTVYKEVITNYSANPNIRLDFTVGIGYEDSISQAQEIAMEVLHQHPIVLDTPEPLVLAENLGAATVNLRIYFWLNGNETQHSKS